LYSPTLVNAQEEFLAALVGSSKALRAASRERLSALGVTEQQIAALEKSRKATQKIKVQARGDGLVTQLMVREGVHVTPSSPIMMVANLDSVWLLAEVFERQSDWVREGQSAEVRLDFLPGKRWQGEVDFVYPELDPATRTLKVRLRFDNPGQALRPNMFARVTIHGTDTAPVVNIPQQALIRGGRLNRVVLALGGGRFRSTAVNPGIESGDRIEIRSGLKEGDRVVTSGQFLIDSESNLEAELGRMGDRPPPTEVINRVIVQAVVEVVDPDSRSITLQHEPIPDWEWPEMTMDFPVAASLTLDTVRAGARIEVCIERQPDGSYLITHLDPADQEGDTL